MAFQTFLAPEQLQPHQVITELSAYGKLGLSEPGMTISATAFH